ncbi:MAG TPA: hypothetical protein ENJ56_06650 [Anaerolineae bacterium]|nr:hypothetical protein [Anaerolineae bacterium]
MPAPEQQQHEPVVDFHCPQCSGETAFSAADGGITCHYCGYHEAPQAAVVGKSAETFEFTVATMAQASHGWGVEKHEVICQKCGSKIVVEADSLTTTCPFCQSNKVIQRKAPQDVLRPRFLIPFSISEDQAHDKTRAWLGKHWLTPKQLQRAASIADFNAMYLPYWTFDAQADARWQAEVGHVVTRKRRGKTVKEIVWRNESGHVGHRFNNIRVSGSQRLSAKLMRQISDYDLSNLSEYDAAFLAGTQAIAYETGLDAAFASARHAMRDQIKTRCQRQASTTRIRNFRMSLDYSDEAWRYILLPVYVSTYYFQNEPYQLLINGQSGTVAGQRPVDWRKIIVAASIPLLLSVLLFFGQEFIQRGDSLMFNWLAAVLFGLGITIAVVLTFKAGEMSDG